MKSEKQVRSALADLKARLTSLLGPALLKLLLFGSRARGDADPDSDIDVAVIVRGLDPALKRRILTEVAEVEIDHLMPLSTLILSEEELRRLKERERRIALDIEGGRNTPVTQPNQREGIREELSRAQSALAAADLLAKGGFASDAVSRLYYSLLFRVRALLLTEGLQPRSHEGALTLLSQHFVKTGTLDRTVSHLFSKLMKYREEAD